MRDMMLFSTTLAVLVASASAAPTMISAMSALDPVVHASSRCQSFSQCGGQNWQGCTKCPKGQECKKMGKSKWSHWQCQEKGKPPKPDPPKPASYSILNPNPDVDGYGHGLTWVNKIRQKNGKWNNHTANTFPPNGYLYLGILRTPLSHKHPETSATVSLQVLMFAYDGQDAGTPLLQHNGGPGSGAQVAVANAAMIAAQAHKDAGKHLYYGFGISQRGVQYEEGSRDTTMAFLKDAYGEAAFDELEKAPKMWCEPKTLKLPEPDATRWGQYRVDEFTTCKCALPNGSPATVETWVDVDPADRDAVEGFFKSIQERNQKCYADPRWQMTSKDNKTYNYLDYLGTNVLAQDIDVLRRALGQEKINVRGASYGTAVAATYGTVFPDHVDKLYLDSNVNPHPESFTFAMGAGRGLEQSVDKLIEMCSGRGPNDQKCLGAEHGLDPAETFESFIDEFRKGVYVKSPEHPDRAPVRVGLGMVTGALHNLMSLDKWKGTVIGTLQNLTSTDKSIRDAALIAILDGQCNLQVPMERKDLRTSSLVKKGKENGHDTYTVTYWREYGVCIANSHIGYGPSSYLDQTGIIGVDYFGRFGLRSAMRKYEEALRLLGVPGTGAFLGWFGAFFDWQVTPNPLRIGTAATSAQIQVVGNLYDPGTPYEMTSKMRAAFPTSSLLTTQDVGHMVFKVVTDSKRVEQEYISDFNTTSGKCALAINAFWAHGAQPMDGMICRQDGPIN